MLAQNNTAITEAAQTMYQLSDDELVRERCRAREEHYRSLRTMESQIREKDDALRAKDIELQAKDDALRAKDIEIAALRAQIASLNN